MATPILGKGLGNNRDKPDDRDFKFSAIEHGSPIAELTGPDIIDLRVRMQIPPYDQESLGSCTANMASYLDVFNRVLEGLHDTYVAAGGASRLGIYYYTRLVEGDPQQDGGASIRDTIKTLNTYGACSESNWPYDIRKFAEKPSDWATTNMSHHKALKYLSVPQAESDIDACLHAGYPIGYGTMVHASFEMTGHDGLVRMPDPPKDAFLGGHAITIVGRKRNDRLYIVRNSWGNSWGDHGYCYIPYDYVLNPELSYDFWTLRLVS